MLLPDRGVPPRARLVQDRAHVARPAFRAAGADRAEAGARAAAAGRQRLVRNITVLLSSQVVIWVVTFVANVFVPRGLGPVRMGELTVAQSIGTILDTVFTLGYGTLMIKEIARDHGRAPSMVGTALLTRLLLLLPGAAVAAVVGLAIHASRELTVLIWLAAAGTFVNMFVGPFTAAFQGLEQMQFPALGNVLSRSVFSLASIVVVWFGAGPQALLVLGVLISVLLLGLSWWWSRPLFRIDWGWSWARTRFLTAGSLPYWTAGLALSFYMWIDSLMLSAMAPLEVVGWYSVPVKLFAALLFMPMILGTAYLPRLSRAHLEGRDALAREAGRLLELAVTASLPVAAGLALVSWQLVKVLYGPAFLPSSPIVALLAIGLPATYVNIVANQVLIASNRQVRWTVVMVVAAIANPLANLFLIRYAQSTWGNGAVGAALAVLATEAGMAVAGVLLIRHTLRWSLVDRLARAEAATLLMSVSVWFLQHRSGLTTMIAGGAATFVLAAVALGVLRDEEIAQVWRAGEWLAARLARPDRPAGDAGRGS